MPPGAPAPPDRKRGETEQAAHAVVEGAHDARAAIKPVVALEQHGEVVAGNMADEVTPRIAAPVTEVVVVGLEVVQVAVAPPNSPHWSATAQCVR